MRERQTKTNIVLILAISAGLHAPKAVAETPERIDVDSQGRTVEEIVQAARDKAERGWLPPDWRATERENKQRRVELRKKRSITFGVGEHLGDTDADYGGVYPFRAAHRNSTPLQFLEPMGDVEPFRQNDGFALFVGFELTPWLDVELAWHEDMNWQFQSFAPVFDPTVSGAVQQTQAEHYSRIEATFYSLSLTPRWQLNDYVAIFGRFGIGYADTTVRSHLTTEGYVSTEEVCTTKSDGTKECTKTNTYERRDWGYPRQRRSEFVPIAGIGVQMFHFLRLEYLYRDDVPIGDATTHVSSLLFLSFKFRVASIMDAGHSNGRTDMATKLGVF